MATVNSDQTTEKVRPVHEIRLGRLKAAFWENVTATGVHYNVTFARIYKQNDAWKYSDSFGRNDLLLLAKLADLAQTWIFEQSSDPDSE